jgi:hypothetical protein
MNNIDMLFATFPDAEMIPIMKRVFDETSAAVHAWGACGTIFEDEEADETIAKEILALAEDGVKDSESLGAFTLSRVGTAALNKVAQDIRASAQDQPTAALH